MKHVTIKDIASHLSISVSTVSRALVDDKNVRKETREKVLAAAKELNYKPNPVATNLKYGHTNTVGVIVPEMITPFASKVINGIQNVLYAHGIKVIVADSAEDPERERENLRMMEHFMVDGIIISLCSYRKNREDYLRLQKAEMPMVFYDRIPHGLDVPQVIVDDYRKSFFLVEKLATRLAFTVVRPTDRPQVITYAISTMIVCIMCPTMSLIATLLFKQRQEVA